MKKKRLGKALALLMSICMVISMCPLTAFAADGSVPEWRTVSTWADLQKAFDEGADAKLETNITASAADGALVVPADKIVTLDLNDKTLNRGLSAETEQDYVIRVQGTLTVLDSADEPYGKITGGYGNADNAGGGIYVDTNATLNFTSGQIQNNTAYHGGGIYVKGTANLTGGAINQNKGANAGAGIYFDTGSHGFISNTPITFNQNSSSDGLGGGGIAVLSNDVRISGSPIIWYNGSGSYVDDIYLSSDDAVLKVVGALGKKAKLNISKGGTPSHYAAVGSGYTLTESDCNKFASATSAYAVKPLNTEVPGGRVELGDSWKVYLESQNVRIVSNTTTSSDTVTLVKENSSSVGALVWKGNDFVFTVSPADGYQKNNDDFCVKYRKLNTDEQITIKPSEDGIYTLPAQDRSVYLYVYGIEKTPYTVEFDTGIDGVAIDPQAPLYIGANVTAPAALTRPGYTFAGWYSDADFKQAWNFDKDTVSRNMTLYAKWIADSTPSYTLSGTVVSHSGKYPHSNAVVTLTQNNGKTVVASVSTGEDGRFSFPGLLAGTYQISATDYESFSGMTDTLTITSDIEDCKLFFPVSRFLPEVAAADGTPDIYVSGLDGLAEEYGTLYYMNQRVRVVMNVAGKQESALPADTVAAIKALSADEPLTYLDIGITYFLRSTIDDELIEKKITDTGTHVQAITVSYDTAGKNISVYRVHNGAASRLTESGSGADGTYRVNDGSVTIYTTKFSTYAIGCTTRTSSGSHSSSSSAASASPVEVKSAANGTVKTDKSAAAKGTTVTITVTPDKGCELNKLTVADKNGKAVSVTAKGSGKYSFTMPDGKVTVAASFTETDRNLAYRDCPKGSTCPIGPFTDAKPTDWYHDGVHFCLENNLMVGYSENSFKPDGTTSRAMLTVMLWRLSGSPTVNYAMQFSDVSADSWYAEAVRWAAGTNVVTGFEDGTFRPDSAVTREQMATVLYRCAKSKNYDVSVGEDTNILSYADAASISAYAVPAMQWACGSGMMQGANGSLNPKNSTTRAQMATMMMRFCAEIVK